MIQPTNQSANESNVKDRPFFRPVLSLFVVWALLVGWQISEHFAEAGRRKALLVESTSSGLHMFEAGLRSMCRGQRQRPDVLEALLDEVAAIPGVRGMWVTEEGGKVIASKGDDRHLPDRPFQVPGIRWFDDGLLVGKQADLGPCLAEVQPGLCPIPSAESPTLLYLLADRSGTDREIRKDLRLRAGILAAVTAAAAGGFLLLRGRSRTRRLMGELAVAEERSRRNREWALLGAGLAHETKNPLAFVRGAAQDLVENGASAAKRTHRAREIVDEVDRVVSRLNEFLQYARPVEPDLEPIRLDSILEEVGRLAETDVAPRGGRLEVSAPPVTIYADRDMLRRILLNLIVNAARAIPEGGWIRLSAAAKGGEGGGAVLEVRDNGHGIDDADLDKVFEPYYTRAPGGTGLGLAIVRRLVEAHGWRVELESEKGVGTVVRLVGVHVIPDEQRREENPRRR